MSSPFQPNLKLEALYAAIQLEKLNVDKEGDVHTGQALVDEAKDIYAWLKESS